MHAVLCCAAGVGGSRMHEAGMADSSLVHITRREYVLNCNWKVFADNYLDGGYHVSLAVHWAYALCYQNAECMCHWLLASGSLLSRQSNRGLPQFRNLCNT
jgi:hypothetical protein